MEGASINQEIPNAHRRRDVAKNRISLIAHHGNRTNKKGPGDILGLLNLLIADTPGTVVANTEALHLARGYRIKKIRDIP
ncbi:MAG: hypothetical protein JWO20_202 [Candidatus Angelobacter sp.]|nr:hypothetical protein [Candidatus Angelobacter sp.]